jgi:nicotinamidase/pyrazinamidase
MAGTEALVVVDYQNDFNPGGALAVAGGDEIADRINALAASGQGGPWPVHCVAGTEGAELHPGLDTANVDVVVDKGRDRDTEGYSGFQGTNLAELLRERGVDHVTVVGLATDYCVKNTALDALREGFGVTVDSTAARGVEVQAGDSERALAEVRAAGGSIA